MPPPRVADPLAVFGAFADVDDTSYLLSDTYRILQVNRAWTRFALANGGAEMLGRWGRGASALDAVSEDLRGFYRALFDTALATGERREHDYECSSDQVLRRFRMFVLPVAPAFLVVMHTLRVEVAHERTAMAADDATYAHGGIIRMCSHCRRVRVAGPAMEAWHWVPDYVARMPANVSHGLCAPCAQVYYGVS